MTRKLKKSVAITILIIFLLNSTGGYLLFSVLKVNNAKIVTAKINNNGFEEEEIVTLTIPVNDPELVFIHSKEFSYKGFMYDVISLRQQDENYTIVAFMDNREKELKENFKDLAEQKHQSNKSKQTVFNIKLLLKDFTFNDLSLAVAQNDNTKHSANLSVSCYQNPAQVIFAPPPEA